jgi:hypothetical protein
MRGDATPVHRMTDLPATLPPDGPLVSRSLPSPPVGPGAFAGNRERDRGVSVEFMIGLP